VGNKKIVSSRFWVYWAVTVPLTLLVLVIWAIWVSVILINYDVEHVINPNNKENGLGNERRGENASMLPVYLEYMKERIRNPGRPKRERLYEVHKKFVWEE